MSMTKEDAKSLMLKVHGHFPTLGVITNPDVGQLWGRELMKLNFGTTDEVIEDFAAGRTKLPGRGEAPALRDICREVRRRMSPKPQAPPPPEPDAPLRLDAFEDGDYVVVDPAFPGLWGESLPGGRIDKTETVDLIAEIPFRIDHSMGLTDGYHLMATHVTNPADLEHIHLMNDEQRENWIKEMDRLESDGQLSQFSKRRG